MELENAMAPIVLLEALQSEVSGLPREWSTDNWRYCRQNLGSETGLRLCIGIVQAPRHGDFHIYMHATDDIGPAEGDLYRATQGYGRGHGIWNTIYCLGRYTRLCGVLPFSWSLFVRWQVTRLPIECRRYTETQIRDVPAAELHRVHSQSTMCRYLTAKPNAEYDLNSDSEIPCYWATEERYTSHSTTMIIRYRAEPSCMRLVVSGATIFKRGLTVLESQPIPQTITVPKVQERTTVIFIHQLRRQAARTTISAPSQVMASTPTDEWTSTPGGEPARAPRDLRR